MSEARSRRERDLLSKLRRVLYHKLAMWDSATEFERYANIDIDTGSDSFDSFCVGFEHADMALSAEDGVIRELLTDEQWEQALKEVSDDV